MAPNKPPSLLELAHQHVQQHLQDGAIAIDATVGNGHDTLFLAKHVAPTGLIYGFDIQTEALNKASNRLQEAQLLNNVRLILNSHSQMAEHIPMHLHGKIAAIMFNLGYLPGTNKQLITQTDSTLTALAIAVELLAHNGCLTILAYPGHAGGDTEAAAVQQWTTTLMPSQYANHCHYSNQPSKTSPRLWVIKKLDP